MLVPLLFHTDGSYELINRIRLFIFNLSTATSGRVVLIFIIIIIIATQYPRSKTILLPLLILLVVVAASVVQDNSWRRRYYRKIRCSTTPYSTVSLQYLVAIPRTVVSSTSLILKPYLNWNDFRDYGTVNANAVGSVDIIKY